MFAPTLILLYRSFGAEISPLILIQQQMLLSE